MTEVKPVSAELVARFSEDIRSGIGRVVDRARKAGPGFDIAVQLTTALRAANLPVGFKVIPSGTVADVYLDGRPSMLCWVSRDAEGMYALNGEAVGETLGGVLAGMAPLVVAEIGKVVVQGAAEEASWDRGAAGVAEAAIGDACLERMCDEIDACVFSSDKLLDAGNRRVLERYARRWLRETAEFDRPGREDG